MPDRPQPRPDLTRAQALAADLDAADFRSDPLRRLWGEEADDALARGLREPILRALGANDGALPTLGRLFVLGMPQPLAAVEQAVPHAGVDGLTALGLVRVGARVVPEVLIRPQSFVDADGVGSGGSPAISTRSRWAPRCPPITCSGWEGRRGRSPSW